MKFLVEFQRKLGRGGEKIEKAGKEIKWREKKEKIK